MFRTILTVTLYKSESTIFHAYFDDSAAAREFAENLTKKTTDEYSFSRRSYLDGSYLLTWLGDWTEITLDDFAWITDWKTVGIKFYDNRGLSTEEFESFDDFEKFIKKSQEIYNS